MDTESGPMPSRSRVPMGLGLRVVGLTILGLLAWALRERVLEAANVIAGMDRKLFVFALGLYVAGLVASALRASLWLDAWELPAGRRALLGDVFAATMLNALAVSGAGEAYRVQALVGRRAAPADAALAVLGDRLLGLAVFAIGAGLGGVWTGAAWMGVSLSGLALPPFAAGCAVVLGLVLAGLPRLRARLVDRIRARPLPRRTLAAVVALALVSLVTSALSVAVLAQALGLDAPLVVVAASAPLVAVAAFLPITIGGIGVREAGYAVLLAPVGVGATSAIALGLAQYLCFLIVAAMGGGTLLARMLVPMRPSTEVATH